MSRTYRKVPYLYNSRVETIAYYKKLQQEREHVVADKKVYLPKLRVPSLRSTWFRTIWPPRDREGIELPGIFYTGQKERKVVDEHRHKNTGYQAFLKKQQKRKLRRENRVLAREATLFVELELREDRENLQHLEEHFMSNKALENEEAEYDDYNYVEPDFDEPDPENDLYLYDVEDEFSLLDSRYYN